MLAIKGRSARILGLLLCEAVKFEGRLEHLLREGADDGLGLFARLEEGDGRDAGDTEATGKLGLSVDVDLGHLHSALVFCSDLVHHRGHLAARRAPGSPEIDEHRHLGVEDFFFERARRDCYGLRHFGSLLSTLACTLSIYAFASS